MAGSGVLICTVSRKLSHWPVTSERIASKFAVRYRLSNSRACSLFSAWPRKNTISAVVPGRNSIRVCSAAQGSRPAPTLPESGPPRSSAAGRSSVPLRPRNSVRSPVTEAWLPPRSAKATRPPNSPPNTLLTKTAPVFESSSVLRYGAEALRELPSTHSA